MDKNEKIALAIGSVLILFVIVLTIFRNNPFLEIQVPDQGKKQNASVNSITSQKTISAKDLQKKITLNGKDSGLILLDVRSFEDYIKEHIVDAINIPLDEFPVGSKIDAHKMIIVIGADSNNDSAMRAYDKLKQENFGNVEILAGGMEMWKGFAGATVTYGDPSSFVDQSKVSYVKPDELNNALKQNVPVYILDIRTNEEYSKGHIPGAKNIPFSDLEKRRSEITEKKAVVVGINELQEFQASVQMYDMLLVSPFVLKEAMPGWEKRGFSVEK